MDPLTIALATFGVQKLRGKSTKRSLRDAAIAGGIGQFAGMAGFGSTVGPNMGSFAPTAFGSVGNTIGAAGTPFLQQLGQTTVGQGIKGLYGSPSMSAEQVGKMSAKEIAAGGGKEALMKGSGFQSFSPGAKLGITAAATTALAGDDDPVEVPEGARPEDYEKAKKEADEQLEGITEGYDYSNMQDGDASPYDYSNEQLYTFSKGGIAEIRKFNKGGINYLPSMTDHDKDDYSNYVRAHGYVEDGSGNGDKDEDTMLAQLADGEFVSRADAILGAGIIEGGDPTSMKDMRKKGAAFFYGQQAKFKRVFDLLDAARKEKN